MLISFDLDGTLLDIRFDDLLWFVELPRIYAKKHKVKLSEASRYCISEYERIGDKDLRWYDINFFIEHFKLDTTSEEIFKGIKHMVRPYPDTIQALEKLKKKKHEMILISNSIRDFLEFKMKADDIGKYFSRIFSAPSDFKKVKKSAAVYKQVCKVLNIKPSEVIHLGDHYEFDYQAAKKAGMKAYYLDRSGKKKGKYVVHDLNEFLKKII